MRSGDADRGRKPADWTQLEFLAAMLFSAWVVGEHVVFLFHAGAMWRDEAGTLAFAAMPGLKEIWSNLRYDNFPPLFVLLARGWMGLGLRSDFDLRVLGFLIGVGTLAVIWVSARMAGARVPLLALALYAANPLAVRVGDSMRPYGIGIALTILTFGLLWRFIEQPSGKNLLLTTLVAVLGVQSLYHCAIFILAFSIAAWAVTLRRGQVRVALLVPVPGMVAAVSLLPYLAKMKLGQEWMVVTKWPVVFGEIWQALLAAMDPVGVGADVIWGLVGVAAVIFAISSVARAAEWGLLYCVVALVAGIVLHLCFLRALGLFPQPWYLLILLAPAAVAVDVILARIQLSRLPARAAIGALVIIAGAGNGMAMLCWRQTNVDVVAETLQRNAHPGDMVLVSPWYYAVSFQRYYGASGITTVPPMEVFDIHRYDLLKEAMAAENPIVPALKGIEKTLRDGHAVWIVGEFHNPPAQPPPALPPYRGQVETPMPKYREIWMDQMETLLKAHTVEGGLWTMKTPRDVSYNPLENLPLIYFHGWKE